MTSPIYQEREEKKLDSDIAISRVEQVKITASSMVKIVSGKHADVYFLFSHRKIDVLPLRLV